MDSAITGGTVEVGSLPTTRHQRGETTAPSVHPSSHSIEARQEGPAVESWSDLWEHPVNLARRQHWQTSVSEPKEAASNGAIGRSRDETSRSSAASFSATTIHQDVPVLMPTYFQ